MRFSAFAVLLLAVATYAGDSRDAAFERLARAGVFAFGRVSYAGFISQGQKDYEAILTSSSALATFEKLYAVGNPQAKSYALVGIRSLSPSRFRELSQTASTSKEEVVTQEGCIVYHEAFGVIVRRMENGKYLRR